MKRNCISPHPGGGGTPGPKSQAWLHKIHFQTNALIPSVDPATASPSILPGTQLGPSCGNALVALGRRSGTSVGDPASGCPRWRTSPLVLALCNLLAFSRHPLRSRFSAPQGRLELGGGGRGCYVSPAGLPTGARDQVPLGSASEHTMSDWTLGPGLPPAVHRSRGDGRRLTRGAEAARRGLDHWPAEGAPPGARPAQPGPLICLYYQQETKLPGTDVPAPSFSGTPQHTLTSAPPARSPQTRRAP